MATTDTADRVVPGAVERWEADGRSLDVELGGPRISVTVLDPGTIHVRSTPNGVFAPRRSWAGTEPDDAFPHVEAEVIDDGDAVTLVTAELAVRVAEGGRVSVFDATGLPLLVDGDEGGPSWSAHGASSWSKRMPDDERYYGFGERLALLDRKGRRYTCWTTDEWRHQGATTDELYVAIPFFMSLRGDGRAYGVLLDNTFRTTFDLTDVAGRRMTWTAECGQLDWYLFAGPEPTSVAERLTRVTGRMPLPPLWALGYHQSRWGYASAHEVLEVARELRRRRIPADAIHLDVDHMDGARVFTFDPDRFPHPEGLVAELREEGLRTVVLVSAGVKQEPGYGVYDSGRERDAFLRDLDGEELTAYVWPGPCVFPDHARADVRRWWGEQYGAYLDVGISGFVNDMNEPAMHDLPIDDPESRNVEPPRGIVHGDVTEPAPHAEVRNAYAVLEARAAWEFLRAARPAERPFLLSRAGGTGIQRYAGVWTGDVSSLWEHLEASLPQVLGLGLSGVPFAGADIGGFFESCGPELLVRWTQLGSLMAFARNHSARGTAPQEPWAWGEDVEGACRDALRLRYRLLPYLYTLFDEAARTGCPPLRPLFFHYPQDPATHALSDEALLGRDLLLAPVVRPGVRARAVYFPEGEWFDLRTGERRSGPGWQLVRAELADGIPVFVRGGAIVPFGPEVETTDGYRLDPLELAAFPVAGRADGKLYEDDYETFGARGVTTHFALEQRKLTARRSGAYSAGERALHVALEGRVHVLRDIASEWELT